MTGVAGAWLTFCLCLLAPAVGEECSSSAEYGLQYSLPSQDCSGIKSSAFQCKASEALHVTTFQAGLEDLSIEVQMEPGKLVLSRLLDEDLQLCAIGDGCREDGWCAPGDFCISYERNKFHYGVYPNNTRKVQVQGQLARRMSLAFLCVDDMSFSLSYSFKPRSCIKEANYTCRNCADFYGCHHHDLPLCEPAGQLRCTRFFKQELKGLAFGNKKSTDCACCDLPYNDEPVRFATAVSMTRDDPILFAVRRGYTLFFDWLISSRGGLCVRGERRPVEFVMWGAETKREVYEVTLFLMVQGYNLFLSPYGSTFTGIAAEVVDKHGGTLVAGTASEKHVYAGRPRVFGLLPTAKNTLTAGFEVFSKKPEGEGISMVGVLTQDGIPAGACDEKNWPAEGWEMAGRRSLSGGTPGKAEIAKTLREMFTDAGRRGVLVGCINPKLCNTLIATINEEKLSLRSIILEVCVVQQYFDLKQGRFVYGTTPWREEFQFKAAAPSLDAPYGDSEKWGARYREWVGGDAGAVPYHAAASWAAGATLTTAIELAGSTDPVKVATVLRNISLHTIFGPVKFDENGQNPALMSVVQYQGVDDQPRLVAPLNSTFTHDAVYPMPLLQDRPCYIKQPLEGKLGFSASGSNGSLVCRSCLLAEPPQEAYFNETGMKRQCRRCDSGFNAYESLRDADLAVCRRTCKEGYGLTETTPRRCRICGVGRFASQGSCRTCSAGRFGVATGQTACVDCPRGTFGAAGATQCSLCEVGRAATSSRSSYCRSCSRGTAAGQFGSGTCDLCDMGMVADELQSQNCTICPPGSYSAWGAAGCAACEVGRYQNLERKSMCKLGLGLGATFNGTGLSGGLNKPRYWASHKGELTWLPCVRAPKACLADERCAEGSTGFMCGACLPGYAHVRQREEYYCFKCPPLLQNVFCTCIMVVAIVALVYWLAANAVRSVHRPQDIRMMLVKFSILYFLIADMSFESMVELAQDYLYEPSTQLRSGSSQMELDTLASFVYWLSLPLRSMPGFTLAAESPIWSVHCLFQPVYEGLVEALQDTRHRDFYDPSYAKLWQQLQDFQAEAEFRVILFWSLWPVLIGLIVYVLALVMVLWHVHGKSAFYLQAFSFFDDVLEIGPEKAQTTRTQVAWTAYVRTYHSRIAGLWWNVPHAEAVYREGCMFLHWKEFHREGLPLLHAVCMVCQGGSLEGVMRAAKCEEDHKMVYANMLECGFDVRYNFSIAMVVTLVFYGAVVPAALFFHTKRIRLDAQPEDVSLVTAGYAFHGWYWEPFLLFMKFMVVYLSHFGDRQVQSNIFLLLGMAYALISMVLQPYQETHNGLCTRLNGHFILLWVLTAVSTEILFLMVYQEEGAVPWFVGALLVVVVAFHYFFLVKVVRAFYQMSLDSLLMSIDIKQWGRSLEEPKNRNILTLIRRRLLNIYVRQLHRRPYVCLYNDYSWVTVCGNRGDKAVLPELVCKEGRVPDLSDAPPAPEFPHTQRAKEHHKRVLQRSLETAVNLVSEVVGTSVISVSIMEFVVRAGLLLGAEHEKRQRQLGRLHSRVTSHEPLPADEEQLVAVSPVPEPRDDPVDILGDVVSDLEQQQPRGSTAAAVFSRGSRRSGTQRGSQQLGLKAVAKAMDSEDLEEAKRQLEELHEHEFLRQSGALFKVQSMTTHRQKLGSSAFSPSVAWWDQTKSLRRRFRRLTRRVDEASRKNLPQTPTTPTSTTDLPTLSRSAATRRSTVSEMMGDVMLAPDAVQKYERRLQLMFKPQTFHRGITLTSLELGVMDLVAVPPHEMRFWLDRFEQAWVRNKDVQSDTSKRTSGFVEDQGVQTEVIVNEDTKPKPKDDVGSANDPYTVGYLPKLGIIPYVHHGHHKNKRASIRGAFTDNSTQTYPQDFAALTDEPVKKVSLANVVIAPMKNRRLAAILNWSQIVLKYSLPDIRCVSEILKERRIKCAEVLETNLREAKLALANTQTWRRKLEKEARLALTAPKKEESFVPPTRKGLYED